jgi:hypothetical protein
VAITTSTVWGTLPNVSSLLGEDTLVIAYPSSILAGDLLHLSVIGTIAGSSQPTANGLWTAATAGDLVAGSKVRHYWFPPVVAAGGEAGNVTITKGSTLSRLIGAIIIKFDGFTYNVLNRKSSDTTNNHNGNPNSGGTPLTASLDDGTIALAPADITKDRKTYSVWYLENAGNSGHPVSETFAGPSPESLIVSTQKDEEGNPSNANTRDRFIRASGLRSYPAGTAIGAATETVTDTSGFANPNQALLSSMSFRFIFESDPAAVTPPVDYWSFVSA